MDKGSADKVIISWLTTVTPYSGFQEFDIGDSGDPAGGSCELYSIYRFFDSPSKCVAYNTTSGSTTPSTPSSFPKNMYLEDQRLNASKDDDSENEWMGKDSHTADKYANLLYQYNISEPISNITHINFTWRGYDTFTNGGALKIFIWNHNISDWENIYTNTSTEDRYINYNLSENFSHYISEGVLYIAVSGGLGGFSNQLPTYRSASPHNTGGVSVDAPLSVYVEDLDVPSDTLTVKFYNASDDSLIGSKTVVGSGTASVTWPGLSLDTDYYWYITVNDGHGIVSSKNNPWNFTTRSNVAPQIIAGSELPYDGATNVNTPIALSVNVSDADGDTMTVTFYDNDAGLVISLPQTVSDGYGKASVTWHLNDRGVTHNWSVIVSDPWESTSSGTPWSFTTKPNTKPVASCSSPKAGDTICQPIIFSWTFFDGDGDSQIAYQVEVKKSSDTWDNLATSSGTVHSSLKKWSCPVYLAEFILYDWRVKVYDGYDWSSWSTVTGFYPGMACQVKCFPQGTMITLADNTKKPIEDVKIGDIVKSYDFETKLNVLNTVISKVDPYHKYYSINNGLIKTTLDHPLYIKKTDEQIGWAAINPQLAEYSYGLSDIYEIEIGDRFKLSSGEWSESIQSIDFVDEYVQTYSLGLSGVNNFYANDILAYGLELNSGHTIHEKYVELKVFHTAKDYKNPQTHIIGTDQEHEIPPNSIEINTDDITIFWKGYDDITDSSELRYQWKLDPNGAWSEFTYDTSAKLHINAPGQYTFTVRAMDLADNLEAVSSTNTLAIEKLAFNKILIISVNETESAIINATNDYNKRGIEDFVRIDFLHENKTFGRAYVIDMDSLSHSLGTSSGSYKTILMNGAVICQKSGGYTFYKKPSFLDSSNVLTLRIMHTRSTNQFSLGNSGKFSILSKVTSNHFIESSNVYNLKIGFFGDTSPAWIKYMTENYNFNSTAYPNIVAYDKFVRLILSHSIVELKMDL